MMRLTPRLGAAVAALAIATAIAAVPSPGSVASPLPSLHFRQSGLAGGRLVNVIAADPTNPNRVLAGGDVSGFHVSTDGGTTWTTSNTGLTAVGQLVVASILFSTATPGVVYAGVGKKGAGGGILRSTDD